MPRKGEKLSPEQKAKWAAHNRPASGIPASGPGWGGDAKGAGSKKRAAPKLATDPASQAEHAKAPRDYAKIARREELEGFWSSVVFDEDEATNYRIAAAEKLYDRKYGAIPNPADEDETARGYVVAPPPAESIEAWTQQAEAQLRPEPKSGDLNPDPKPSS